MLTPKQMVEELIRHGLSQKAIAKFCGSSQPTISRVAKGRETGYAVGKKIEALHHSVLIEQSKNMASTANHQTLPHPTPNPPM